MRLQCLAQQEVAATVRLIAPVLGWGHVRGKEGRRATLANMDTGGRGISRGSPVSYNYGRANDLLNVVERCEEGNPHA
jgi:hypothetical protein